MMDISFISNRNSSRRMFDRSQNLLNQNYEVATTFSEYSSLAELKPNSNINYIYNGFKEITKFCSENSDYLKMVDDFNKSLFDYLENVKKTLNMYSRQTDPELSNAIFLIYNEIKTWKLVHLLYEDRFKNKSTEITKSVNQSNVLFSELEVVMKLYKSNQNLREAQIVVDWLEFFLREKVDNNTDFLIGSHGKSWEHTKYLLNKKGLLTNNRNNIVNELDPDAPLRGKLNLTTSDQNNENDYLKYLFHCVQSGDIEKAKMICINHDELWRAQSLEGWKPFYNPMVKENNSDLLSIDIIGNPNRNLFKLACQKMCDNTDLNVYERAIYAIFCGNLPVLSLIEKDWSGLLWAHFKVYIESMIDINLTTYTNTGFFNTHSLFGEDDLDLVKFPALNMDYDFKINNGDDNLNMERIFDEISLKLVHDPMNILKKGFNTDQKPSRSYYQSVYEMVQQFIILEDISGLIEHIQSIITHFPTKKNICDKNIIRFLTHIVIFIYSIHEDLLINVYHKVLEEYIQCLLEDKWLENVAFYISKLSTDLQIKWYCICLMGVTNQQERRKCVEEGLEYDLPIVEITRLLVESMRLKENEQVIKTKSHMDPNFEDRDTTGLFVSDVDKAKIDSLDWLCFTQEQQCHLIRQANALCRIMLENDKLQAAKMVMNKITDDVWTYLNINTSNGPKWLTNALYENECLRRYIQCNDLFGDWYNHFTCQKPTDINIDVNCDLNKLSFQEKQLLQKTHDDHLIAMQQWWKLLHFHANKVFENCISLLQKGTDGWLSDIGEDDVWLEDESMSMTSCDIDNDKCQSRKLQINRLRSKCIVSIVFMCINVMTNSDEDVQCFTLIDLVADDKYQLCNVFSKTQLQKLLHKTRQCSLQLMSQGRDALGIAFE